MKKGLVANLFYSIGAPLLGGFLAWFLLFSHPVNAGAGINQTINFQGRLLNSQGATVPDGFYNIEFKIYQDGDGQSTNDSTGSPAGSLKWTEDWLNSASHGVKVVNGYLSVNLGSVSPFGSSINWNQSVLWLSMQIGNTSSCTISTDFHTDCGGDGEMTPMQPLTAAPYALNSNALNGLSSNNFVQLAQGVQTDASSVSSIFINKTGTSGDVLELQKGGVDVMSVSNSGTAQFQPSADSATALQVLNHANSYSVFTVDTSNNQVVLGKTSSLTGKLAFANSAGANTITIVGPSANPSGNYTLTIPTITANANICTDNSVCTGYAPSATNGYVQLAPAAAQSDTTTNSSIFINKTSTGDLLQLRQGGSDKFVVDNSGNVTTAGTYNSTTVSGSALTFGTAGTATIQPAASQALTITGHAASTWSLDAGNLTVQTTAAASSLLLDAGTAGNGTVSIGSNANSLSLGYGSGSQTVNIGNSSGTNTIGIGANGSATNTITIGTTNSSSSVSILGGAGGAVNIGSTGSSTVASTINIANTTDATGTQTVNIGSGAKAANATNIKAGGTGGISLGANTTLSANSNFTYASGTGKFDASQASGTFDSSTGANHLNGNTTVTGTNTFSVNAGATTLNGAAAGSGTAVGITTGAASNIGLNVQAAASQTANLLQIQDSTGANLLTYSASGNLEQLGNIDTPFGGLGTYGNLLTQSEAFNNGGGAPWTYSSVTTPSANTVAAPDGNTTAESLADTSSGGKVSQSVAGGNNTYTFSVWLKTASGTQSFALRIDSNGTPATGTAVTGAATTTWQRFSVTQTFTSGVTTVTPTIFPGGTGGSGTVAAWGAQLVQSGTKGVYVRTIGSTVTASDGLVDNGTATFQSAASSVTAFQVQNTSGLNVMAVDTSGNQVVLGTLGSSGANGQIVFNSATASNYAVTLNVSASQAASYTLTLPTTGPSNSQCLQSQGSGSASQLVFGPCGATGTFLAKNATDTSSASVGAGSYLYTFTNNNSGPSTGGVLKLDNQANTGSTLSATASGNPGAGNAVIYAQNTNASPSGNLLDLESGSTPSSKFSVDANGNVSLGGASPVALQGTASNGTLNITANGTGTLSIGTTGAGTVNVGHNNATAINIGTSSVISTIAIQTSGITQTLTGSATTPSDIIKTSTDNSSAFQIQNHNSYSVFGVDTSGNQAVLGQSNQINGTLLFKNSSSSNGITLNSTATSSNYTLTLPTVAPAGGLCIETQTGNASQLIFASCSNNNASIQEVHEWDANNQTTLSVSPSTAGDEMVLTTQIPTGGVTVSGVSGGGVTTWNKVIANSGNGTVNRVEMWVGTVTTTGGATITVTYVGGSAGSNEITTTEFTAAGVNANTSWGIESSASQLNSTSSTTVTYPNMTAVNGSELYVGYAQVQNAPATSGSTTGFAYIQTSTQHNMITYNTSLAANTAYQPTANQNSSGQSNTVAAILTAFVTSSSINNTTSLQKANFYVQAATSGTVAGVLQAASSGTADILDLRNSGSTNVLTVSSAGNLTVQPAASASAFKVLNGSSYSVLGVDTSGNQVTLGDATHLSGKITFADSGDSNTISLLAPSSIASSYNLKLPNNTPSTGLCLATSPSDANQLLFSSCATQVSAASISYVNEWDNHGSGVTTISDSPASLGNLLVFYSHTANAVTVNSLSGGGVTTWYKVTSYTGGGTPGNIEMWRGVVTTTGSGTVTVSYSGTAGTNEIVAQEFTMGSANGTWAIDTSGTATTTSSVTTVNYPSLTPLNSNELYAGYAYGGGTMSTGSTTGFTYVATGATKYLAYKTNVSGGTPYAPTAPQTSGVYASIAAVIEAYTGTSVIVNTTSVQDANFNVQAATAGTVAGILQEASGGTADVLQVKDSSGNNVMSVNPSSGLTLGTSNVTSGSIVFNASGNSNSITITAPSAPGATYSLTLPTTTPAPGECLATSPSNANQLVFSSCANQVTSVAISLVNNWKVSTSGLSPTLSVSPANLGDLMTFFIFASKSNTINSVSGGGVTAWSKIVGANSEEMWRGIVTSTGSSTITVSLSTPSGPTDELAAQEWTTGSTNGSWVVDSSGTISNSSSTTVTYPSLTPQSTKDLYMGYAIGTSTMSAGSTSGFSYLTGGASSNMGAYNTTVSTTTQPTASQSGSGTSIAAAALIAAYSSSSVIANSTNTQQANFNVQAATSGSVAGTLQAYYTGTGDILDLLDGSGTLVGKVTSTGNHLVKPSTASAAAFQVQTTGSVNVFSVDTSANQVVVGAGSTGESSPSLLVVDNETGTSADPTEVNGAMYYNATTHEFRCGVAGAWQNCSGLIYSNTSKSSAVSNCTNNCAAFNTAASIPANYCQAGRVIKLSAAGYFSSLSTASQLQFGVYYGTDASVASNDTLIGSLSPAESVASASNNYFQMNFNIVCFSTTTMQAEGNLNLQIGGAAAGATVVPMNSTGGTTVVSTSTKNLYIFPIWDTASSSNTATITQYEVSGF